MEIEQLVYELLEKEFGRTSKPINVQIRENRLTTSIQGLDLAKDSFIKNSNTLNWKMMISAMATYQYWQQKRTTEEEE
ncbi:hypothetical protein QKV95_gp016 [Poseidoniales virus YSH_150918]|uniref:Uncharacterized protein n=1 Tax=Poseidoniales virus YSH_150918 TaxID=3071324 RepID=A0A976UAU3_9CAUD|nr:hypothetical protein QKV95_gp016 [Yangshan Harbor Poseidoniales virus]UVF62490.1 hypothetical protein [Poseidoniales virus YSH_150918]